MIPWGFFQVFYDKYTKIKHAFEIDMNVLVMFKNITTTSKYNGFLKIYAFTIIIPMIDEEKQKTF